MEKIEKKTAHIHFDIGRELKDKLKLKAKEMGMTLTAYFKQAALDSYHGRSLLAITPAQSKLLTRIFREYSKKV